MKLNIGSGAEIIEGYQSVDLFVPADIKDDITKLENFKDNSVDEVRTFHLLEHLREQDVILAMKQVYRVLKVGGKWTIEVPDLIAVLEQFLKTPEKERWGYRLNTIFGLQSSDGEYHKTGFSGGRLGELLSNAGFNKINIVEKFSKAYDQGVLDAVAFKL